MPTLLDMVTPDMKVAREEIFGPVVATLRVSSAAEAYQVGNSTPYGLSTSVFTRSLSEAHHAMDVVDSGVIYINRGTSSAELGVPFGGTGMSGNGHREVSADGFDFMSEIVSIYVDPRVGSRDD
jgi:acyl-CoA reductase-like NAD-dependent aldehyde dehydrogenase